MNDITKKFMETASQNKITNSEIKPEVLPTKNVSVGKTLLARSTEKFEIFDIEQVAIEHELSEREILGNTEFVETEQEQEQDYEVQLDFDALDFFVPYACSSYDELATIVVGNIFIAENINNINADFFGSLMENCIPLNCSKVGLGNFTFVVREDTADRLVYLFEFLSRAKEDLVKNKRYECNLVEEIEVNYSVGYTLVLTPKDLRDIKKSYPQYNISFIATEDILDMKLIIQVE